MVFTTAFPNISILVRIFLSIPITNCEGERSFSTLSRVKNHPMSTMGQTRLSSLSLLCIESGLLQYLDTNSIIDKFSKKKQKEVIAEAGAKLNMLQVNCISFKFLGYLGGGGGGALKNASSVGRRENFWGISREKSRFYAKKSYIFSNFRGVRPCIC